MDHLFLFFCEIWKQKYINNQIYIINIKKDDETRSWEREREEELKKKIIWEWHVVWE